jgi:hypothetical protein
MGFIMDGLDAESYDRKYSDRDLIKRIIGYFRGQRKLMLTVAGLVVGGALVDAAYPLLISHGLDVWSSQDEYFVSIVTEIITNCYQPLFRKTARTGAPSPSTIFSGRQTSS